MLGITHSPARRTVATAVSTAIIGAITIAGHAALAGTSEDAAVRAGVNAARTSHALAAFADDGGSDTAAATGAAALASGGALPDLATVAGVVGPSDRLVQVWASGADSADVVDVALSDPATAAALLDGGLTGLGVGTAYNDNGELFAVFVLRTPTVTPPAPASSSPAPVPTQSSSAPAPVPSQSSTPPSPPAPPATTPPAPPAPPVTTPPAPVPPTAGGVGRGTRSTVKDGPKGTGHAWWSRTAKDAAAWQRMADRRSPGTAWRAVERKLAKCA